MNDPFIQAIADRIRDVVSRHSGRALDLLAEMLRLEPRAFRALIQQDERALNHAFVIDVVAAFVAGFAIDPQWLLTGHYDAATHRRALVLGDDRGNRGEIAWAKWFATSIYGYVMATEIFRRHGPTLTRQ